MSFSLRVSKRVNVCCSCPHLLYNGGVFRLMVSYCADI